ncbi:MAG: energy-coupling factor transporter transmembrane component T [Syntrophales bacterium]|nr:energy-coupling factor transporter transmembrane component T [Syntrophales bacterium]MDD5643464.1 energy-coupling factor transporter transmembrane component T [Syntrophales bacterium]
MQENNPASALPAPTLIHRLDPRVKVALLLMSFWAVLLPQRPEIVALATLLVLLQVGLAHAWGELRRLRWLLFILAIFSLAVWSMVAQGPTLLFWRVSRESLAFGCATFLKLGTMMVAGLVLLATTPVEELFRGLVKLKFPYPAAFAFALALRWVPEVFATAQRVKEAQEARGLVWEAGGPLTRLKRHLPLLVPIFLLTLRRSQTIAWALESRGFQMRPTRTYLLDIRLQPRDYLALGLAGTCLVFFLTLHLLHWDQIPGLKL